MNSYRLITNKFKLYCLVVLQVQVHQFDFSDFLTFNVEIISIFRYGGPYPVPVQQHDVHDGGAGERSCRATFHGATSQHQILRETLNGNIWLSLISLIELTTIASKYIML